MSRWIFCLTAALAVLTAAPRLRGAETPLEWPQNHRSKVFFLPQFSEFESISESEMRFFRKTLDRAAREQAQAVILELDTPGGSVETAFKYLSVLEKSSIPVIVYLNPNGISAGMIIALGADRVAISPNGLIGDAMPIEMGLNGVRPVTDRPQEKAPEKAPAVSGEKAPKAPEKAPAAPGSLEQILQEIRKLKENPSDPRYIHTELGIGYRMLED